MREKANTEPLTRRDCGSGNATTEGRSLITPSDSLSAMSGDDCCGPPQCSCADILRDSRPHSTEVAPLTDSTGALVSVVVPCYNQGRFLADAVESVLRQTHQNVEL